MHIGQYIFAQITTFFSGAFFVIREMGHPTYDVISGEDFLEGEDNVIRDQAIRFIG